MTVEVAAEEAGVGASEYAPGYRGWRAAALLVFLVLLNIVNFIDRQLLQSFVVDVRRDLDLSYFQFSLLTGLFFSISYTVAGVFLGMMADRVHRGRLIAGGLAVWSALTAACGMAQNFAQLAVARTFVALGEATLAPSALSMISDVFPDKRTGLASGIYYLGIPIGAGGSLLLAGLLGPIIGWRGCFYLMGMIGLFLAVGVLLLKDPPRRSAAADAVPPPPLRQALPDVGRLLSVSPSLCCLLPAAALVIFSQGALVLDQAWLVEERGFSVPEAQTIFGILFLIAGVFGAFLGGWLSDLFHRGMTGGRMYFLAFAFILVGPAGIAFRLVESGSILFYAAAVIGSIAIMLPYGAIVSTVADLSPAGLRATMISLTILAMALIGAAGGNAFAGWLSDHFISLGMDQPLTWALMISGGISMLAIPLFLLAGRFYALSRGRLAHFGAVA